ncbi:MAG: response regulator [Magnetococcus sp. WYHC-3]
MVDLLICDDDHFVRTLLKSYLNKSGYRVDEAEDGYAAMEAVSGNRYRLIVTDVFMPGVNGLALISWLAENVPATPVVAISGGSCYQHPKPYLRGAKYLGVVAAMQKPLDPARFMEVIQQLLGAPQHAPAEVRGAGDSLLREVH